MNFKIKMLTIIGAFLSLPAFANAQESVQRSDKFLLSSFQVNGLYVEQANDRSTTSVMAAWTPQYQIQSNLGLRANLGISSLKNATGGMFAVYDAELMLRYSFNQSWDLEAGGGVQIWQNNGGANPIATLTMGWKPSEKIFNLVDRFFVGYSRYYSEVNAVEANQILFGYGIQF